MWPGFWGDKVWTSIHFIALSYPQNATEDRQKKTYDMLNGLFTNLPCPSCSYHALLYLQENSPDLSTRTSFLKWTIDMHNSVNKRNGKRSDWTIEEFTQDIIDKHMSDGEDLSRAELKRREDHKYIMKLKQSKSLQDTNVLNISTLVTCILILIVCCTFLFKMRNKRCCKKK
jgi:hypothetical protein